MVRTLTALGFALALVGSAHAQDARIVVSLDGKSHGAIRSEIYRAAEKVCTNDSNAVAVVDTTCVEASYFQAMQQLRTAYRVEHTAYVQAPPADIR